MRHIYILYFYIFKYVYDKYKYVHKNTNMYTLVTDSSELSATSCSYKISVWHACCKSRLWSRAPFCLGLLTEGMHAE